MLGVYSRLRGVWMAGGVPIGRGYMQFERGEWVLGALVCKVVGASDQFYFFFILYLDRILSIFAIIWIFFIKIVRFGI